MIYWYLLGKPGLLWINQRCVHSKEVQENAKIHKLRHTDANEYEIYCWSMSRNHFVKDIIANVEERSNNN